MIYLFLAVMILTMMLALPVIIVYRIGKWLMGHGSGRKWEEKKPKYPVKTPQGTWYF